MYISGSGKEGPARISGYIEGGPSYSVKGNGKELSSCVCLLFLFRFVNIGNILEILLGVHWEYD